MKPKLIHNPHPGEILSKDFLKPMRISQYRLAKDTGLLASRISRLVRGQVSVSADTALRLGFFFGIDPKFWLNLQNSYDMREFERKAGSIRRRVRPWVSAAA
ncbi:MAG TPA: HigA family addiction module antitoxin [Opitutaceae bacterium]|jgi:addiction module HigA family antidote|nr:HigA family addiction module antitoxin [Opitutaceae bacterium]